MSKVKNLICAAIGAAALVATPAFAAGQRYGDRAAGAKIARAATGHVVHPRVAQGLGAFAYSPSGAALNDPTMYLVQHDIPIRDKSIPGMP